MKRLAAVVIFMMTFYGSFSQDITGQWTGILKVQGMQLRVVFNISKTATGYSSTMDSPDQGAKGIPVTSTIFDNPKLKIEVSSLKVEYTGEFKDNIVTGTFKQSGMEFPMNLSKEKIEKQSFVRPQEPKKPYPYYSEDVTFQNPSANITLAGTLTLPQKEGHFPAVILVTGSGPQNRDEELMGHKPFLVLSDYLTRKGIAVLRYDDRGVGQSKGNFQTAITTDFASDAESAVAYLKTRKEITKIGIAGHSEGGIIAPMVALKTKDVGFIVMLAGTGLRGDKILLLQQELIARASGVTEADIKKTKENNSMVFGMVLKSKSDATLKEELRKYLNETLKSQPANAIPKGMKDDEFISLQLTQLTNPWMLNFIRYDPIHVLEKVKCPVLAVNGDKDLQVPSKENLPAIEKALKKAGNKNVTIKEFKNLNHLFQECKTGLPAEYAGIDQTFSPVAMEEISNWILQQTK